MAQPAAGMGEPLGPAQFRRVHVIINPVSEANPVLHTLNLAFHPAGLDWEVFVTKQAGDARRYAREAVEAGADAVVVYGGDGTVGEAASGLVGTAVPLAILPGGTANVMSVELGIPSDLAEACALVCSDLGVIRSIDVGQIGEFHFLTRVGIGFEGEMVAGANRDLKDRVGWLAYALSALEALKDPVIAQYRLNLDGREIEVEGLTCFVANSGLIGNAGTLGKMGLNLAPGIDVGDGLLDVVVLRKADLGSLFSVAASVIAGSEEAEPLLRWQAREIGVVSEPPQVIEADGEIIGHTPVHIRVLPQSLRVVVPGVALKKAADAANAT